MRLFEFQFVDQHGRLRTTRAPQEVLERLHREADLYEREQQRQRPRFEQPTYRNPYYERYPRQAPNSTNRPPSSDPFANLNDIFSNLGGSFDDFAEKIKAAREREAKQERERKAREEDARKQRQASGKYATVSAWVSLCLIAGVDETTPRSDKAKVIRKAQRKCHPDTGGSHDKWIELENILRRI